MTDARSVAGRPGLSAFVDLTKPRITTMVVFTTLIGYLMAARDGVVASSLAAALLGTALVASGASALNMVMERRTDALMERTRGRPIPSGRIRAATAAGYGLVLTALGLALLGWRASTLAMAVAAVTWASYLFAYTPLKTRTSFSTVVGAFPGALPPVIGWTGAGGALTQDAFVLFAILFLWQLPHFLAIAWLYRDDYARGGLPTLAAVDPTGRAVSRHALVNCAGLVVVSLVPTFFGMSGWLYLGGATLFGLGFAVAVLDWARTRSTIGARRAFLTSVLYLPLLYGLLVIDRIPR